MRRMKRTVMLMILAVLLPAVAGCSNFDADKLDIFGLTDKPKLPGERKPVFPEGVPGVSQGVPPEYIRGNQPVAEAVPVEPVQTAPVQAAPARATAAVEPARPRPQRQPRASQPTRVTVQPAAPPAEPQPQQAQTPWPVPAQDTAPSTAPSTAPWPAAPPPGTFTR